MVMGSAPKFTILLTPRLERIVVTIRYGGLPRRYVPRKDGCVWIAALRSQ
jgi:hypothetical protein